MNWRYRYTVLVLCTLAFASTMVARLSISPVVPLINADFGVNNAATGLALSGMWATYALTQFPSGVLGDRFGERRVILVAVGLTALTGLLLAVSPSFPAFLLFTVVLGVSAGLHYTVATTYLAKLFAENLGRAVGFHVAGGPLAGLLAPVAAAAIGARYGWRPAMLLGTAVALPVFILFALRVRPTPADRPDQSVSERLFTFRPLVELLSRPEILYTMALATLGAFSWQATASFLPTFLAEGRGLTTTTAGALFSLYFVVHGATQPLTGTLSDRLDRDAAAMVTMAAGIVGYATLVAADGLPGAVVGVCLAGLAMSWGAPVQSRFMDKLSAEERSAGFGLVRTVYMVVGASGSVVVGTLSVVSGWEAAFGLLSGLMAVGLSLLLANRFLRLGL